MADHNLIVEVDPLQDPSQITSTSLLRNEMKEMQNIINLLSTPQPSAASALPPARPAPDRGESSKGPVREPSRDFGELKLMNSIKEDHHHQFPLKATKFQSTIPFIRCQIQNVKGTISTVLQCTEPPTRLEMEMYKMVKLDHAVVEQFNNFTFEEAILFPLKLQTLTIESTIPSQFIQSVFQQCTNLVAFRLFGEIDGDLVKGSGMGSSIIEKVFPNLKEFTIDIGSFHKKYLKTRLNTKEEHSDDVQDYEKWARDTMALTKGTRIWAPKLELLKLNTVISKQWSFYQTSTRILGLLALQSKSLKNLDLTITSVIPDDETLLSKMEEQHMQSIIKSVIQIKKFRNLQSLRLDFNTPNVSYWMKIAQAQNKLQTLRLNQSVCWADVILILQGSCRTLQTLDITSDFSSANITAATSHVDFSVIRRCTNLITISLKNFSSHEKVVVLEKLDFGRNVLPRLENVSLIGFRIHQTEMQKLTEKISQKFRLKKLIIYYEESRKLSAGEIRNETSSVEQSTTTLGGGNYGNPEFGFTWETFRKFLQIRTLETVIVDPKLFYFKSVVQMANVCNLIRSFADVTSQGLFVISN